MRGGGWARVSSARLCTGVGAGCGYGMVMMTEEEGVGLGGRDRVVDVLAILVVAGGERTVSRSVRRSVCRSVGGRSGRVCRCRGIVCGKSALRGGVQCWVMNEMGYGCGSVEVKCSGEHEQVGADEQNSARAERQLV